MSIEAAGMQTPEPRPGNRSVELMNDYVFSKIRRSMGVRDDFLNEGWNLASLRSGGGKGGTLIASVQKDFIVKELSTGDHAVLCEIARSYLDHVTGGDTRLCRILMHFRDCETGRLFFAMTNEVGPCSPKLMYDLKGCDDDKTLVHDHVPVVPVRKRIWNVMMWGGQCMWTPQRLRYFEGKVAARKVKIQLPREHRQELLSAIQRDTEWLSKMGLMDYSLLVSIRSTSDHPLTGDTVLGNKPMFRTEPDGEKVVIHMGIIDFLQKWNGLKTVAGCVKVMERNKSTIPPPKYALRFRNHFTKNIVEIPAVAATGDDAEQFEDCDAELQNETVRLL